VPVVGQLPERGGVVGLPEDHHLPDPGPGRRLPGRGQEGRDRHQQAGARAGQLAGQLVGREQGVGHGDGAAGRHRPVEGERVLGQVGAGDGEHVAGPEAARGQAGGDPLDPVGQPTVGQRPAAGAVDQGRLVAQVAGVLEQEVGERHRVAGLQGLAAPDPGAGHGRGGHRTASAGRRVVVGVGARNGASEADMGVNQWPASQPVLTCSTGPSVDGKVQRSDTQAGAWQVGSGQATTSTMGSSRVGDLAGR
jgi:hypothetical protein